MTESDKRSTALDAITVLRNELKQGHDILEQAVLCLPEDQLHHRGKNSTIQSIATIYAHTVMSEDRMMNDKILERASIFERDGWAESVGIEIIPFGGDYDTWVASVAGVDFGALREYADNVYAESDRCLAALTESDLDRTVTFVDKMPLGSFLGTIIVWHAIHHAGEICALKGVLGGRGLPF